MSKNWKSRFTKNLDALEFSLQMLFTQRWLDWSFYYLTVILQHSERPKSKLVWFSDVQLLAQFQMVRYSDNVQNVNEKVLFLDDNLCSKSELVKGQMGKNRWDFRHAVRFGPLKLKPKDLDLILNILNCSDFGQLGPKWFGLSPSC